MRTSLTGSLLVILTASSLPLTSTSARQQRPPAPAAPHAAPAAPHPEMHQAPREAPHAAPQNFEHQMQEQRQGQENAQRQQKQMQDEQRQVKENSQRQERDQAKQAEEQQKQMEKESRNQERGREPNRQFEENRGAAPFNPTNPYNAESSHEQKREEQRLGKLSPQQPGEPGRENNRGGREFEPTRGGGAANFNRGGHEYKPRPQLPALNAGSRVNWKKATPPPFTVGNATGRQRQQALVEQQSLQRYTYAVPINQAPPNYAALQEQQMASYFNNYPAFVNNQELMINARNTYFNAVQPGFYPSWWQQQPGWAYCNGFTLGNVIRCGMNFLGMGWQPYWGPQPTGFICNDHYFPTPWIYNPYSNTWIQPGSNEYSQYGPGYNYTGPITVEILEPTNVMIQSAYGVPEPTTINEMYLYDAFYYPEAERWGYLNRNGYFVWLNL